MASGTDGVQRIYDWGQTEETYTYARNINDFSVAKALLDCINNQTGQQHNNLYVIYYFDGDHYINQHSDKDKTFVDGTPFFLLNLLLEGDPRVFQFSKKSGTTLKAIALKDNEALEVSADANNKYKHGLKTVP